MEYNDKEIVQTLKNHIEAEDCVTCESFGKCNEFLLTKNTLDLINRQKEENERLKNKILEDDRLLNDRVQESINAVCSANQKYVDALEKAFNDRAAELQTAKAEIERLNTENNKNFDKWNILEERTKKRYAELYEEAKSVVRAKAVKEFAERLKEKAYIFESGFEANEDRTVKIVALKDIDNLVKEMIGDAE